MAQTIAPGAADARPSTDVPVVVLHALTPPDGTTRYVDQIAAGAPAQVAVRYFSWPAALLGRYDVLHLHWPELLLRGRRVPKRLVKRFAMRLLLVRLAATRTPLVRTVHNVHPHEAGGRAETRLLGTIDRGTDLFIRLNPTTPPAGTAPTATILHGHYRDRFAGHPRAAPVPGRLLYFGLIRPYKGVDALIALAPALHALGLQVRIVGAAEAGERDRLAALVPTVPGVTAELAFVADDRLVQEVGAAELVVLPYRELHNSGVLLVALSLDRPVLVPRTASTAALAAEVGSGWVHLYDGDLDAPAVAAAVAAVRAGPGGRPDLRDRDWAEIGRQHLVAYRAVIDRVRG